MEKLIEELIPIKQMFLSYEQLALNPSLHFDHKIFKKCANKIDKVIEIINQIKEVK